MSIIRKISVIYCLFMVCISLISVPGQMHNFLKITENRNVKAACKNIRKARFRRVCNMIAGNPLINEQFASNITASVKNVTELDFVSRELVLGSFPILPIGCFPDNLLNSNSHLPENLRSLSPWHKALEFNELRFPQELPIAKCLCDYCINPVTLKEDSSLISSEVTVKTLVIKKFSRETLFSDCTKKTCEHVLIDVAVACHCIPARIVINGGK